MKWRSMVRKLNRLRGANQEVAPQWDSTDEAWERAMDERGNDDPLSIHFDVPSYRIGNGQDSTAGLVDLDALPDGELFPAHRSDEFQQCSVCDYAFNDMDLRWWAIFRYGQLCRECALRAAKGEAARGVEGDNLPPPQNGLRVV